MTERVAILARLARLAAASDRNRHLAERLAEACRLILGADGASICVYNDSPSRLMLAATDETAKRLEDLQDVLGEGPCMDAFHTGQPVVARLGAAADHLRWSEFTRSARQVVGEDISIRCFAMHPAGQTFGTLSLYLRGATEVAEADDTAQFLANSVGVALLRDPSQGDGVEGAGAWSSRSRIHQATGMVIAQLRLSADDALAILRAHAYANDTNLADIADQVVGRRLHFLEGDS